MFPIFSYNDFLKEFSQRLSLKNGLVIDTNVLISATYDSDPFYDLTNDFLDFIFENKICLFCNVSVRAEFLEIHRRIIFSEALFDFNNINLPMALSSQLSKWKKTNQLRKASGKVPLRLSESDIKAIKLEMLKITDSGRDLWSILCEERIGNKLSHLWQQTIDDFGLNFLSNQKENPSIYLNKNPDWDDVIFLIEKYGISSSDAMILNMFFASKFEALISSDLEIAMTLKNQSNNKICFVPDRLKRMLH